MTREELIEILAGPFHADFADVMARRVCDAGAVGLLYEVATCCHEQLPEPIKSKVLFRGAYVLERIYFSARGQFMPYADAFCRRDFAGCTHAGARRHFAKIMADLLVRHSPHIAVLEQIAGAAAEWAVEPGSKVAVRIWAVEVLKQCRGRVGWLEEGWYDIVEALSQVATPGIECRMRKSWRPRQSD